MPEIVQWLEFTGIGGVTAWILLVNTIVFYFLNLISIHFISLKKLFVVLIFFIVIIFGPIIISKQLKWSDCGSSVEILALATNESQSNYYGNSLDYLIDLTG